MSIVRAIQRYSNITANYVNKWRPLGAWVIGSSLRSGVIDAINNYINVCKSLKLAHYAFDDEQSLKSAFPINWTVGALCMALKNLKEQGMNALALVAQVGGDEVKGLDTVITSYISIIDHNRNVLKSACAALAAKNAEKVKLAIDKATIKGKTLKLLADKLDIANTLKGLFDLSAPTILLGLVALVSEMSIFDTSRTGTE
jgi:hypothetical protein